MVKLSMLAKLIIDNGLMNVGNGGACEHCVMYEPCQHDAADKKRTHKSFRDTCSTEIGPEYVLTNTRPIENKEELFQMMLATANIGSFHS